MICLHDFEQPLDHLWVYQTDILYIRSGHPNGQTPGGATIVMKYGQAFHVYESAADVAAVLGATEPPQRGFISTEIMK